MKPIKIKISGFGPYSNEVFIDFTKFYDNGIFLITGDTGSGKTTIFDAICFALFGNASGSNREKNSFRSDFAGDDVKTFVEFEFSNKDIVYKINRSPNYMRKKIRGEGYTQVSGDASIIYLDKVITGDKNVTEKCIEILGIDYNQFKQISMIAQGEFLKLLFAKPSERADIFRKIFDTYIYRNISDVLKKKYLEKKREYEDTGVNFDSLKDNVLFDMEIDKNVNIEEFLELVALEISNDEDMEKKLENDKQKLLNELQEMVSKISNIMMINDSFKKYEEAVIRLEELKKLDKEISLKKEITKKNKDIYNIIEPIYKELIKLQDSSKEKNIALNKQREHYKEIINEYNKLALEYSKLDDYRNIVVDLKNKIKNFEDKLPLFEEIKDLKNDLKEKKNIYNLLKLNELDKLLDRFDRNRSILEKLSNEKNNLLKLKEIYDSNNEKYNLIYNQFISCQAGIIASTLSDDNPCPVCGSLNHPNKAKLDDNDITKEKVNEARNILENSRNDVDLSSNLIISLKKELEISNDEIKELNEDNIIKEIEDINNNIDNGFIDVSSYDFVSVSNDINYISIQLENKLLSLNNTSSEEEIRKNISCCKDEILKLDDKISKITKNYDDLLKEKVRLESVIKVLEDEIKNITEDIDLKNTEYINSYNSLGYYSSSDYLSVKINLNELELVEKDIYSYDNELSEVSSKVDTLKDFIKGKNKEDTSILNDKRENLNININEIDVSLKKINSKINNNKNIFDKIKFVYQRIKRIEKELSILEDLSNTANGTIKGKNKLEFEQYVQASYFDDVLVSANERFSYMTDSRYILLRRVEASKISDKLGLELEVFDNYTGKRRDITTLSGGESFKASLSLALGMSDVIQNYSGGIVVETMFIDEGFGSLDDESLEQAMNTIMKLSDDNRLIGIISHVNELKDRIDKKIVVKKSNTGSSVSIVI